MMTSAVMTPGSAAEAVPVLDEAAQAALRAGVGPKGCADDALLLPEAFAGWAWAALDGFEAAVAVGDREMAKAWAERTDALLARAGRVVVGSLSARVSCARWWCDEVFVFEGRSGSAEEAVEVGAAAVAAAVAAGWCAWTYALTCPGCPGHPSGGSGAGERVGVFLVRGA